MFIIHLYSILLKYFELSSLIKYYLIYSGRALIYACVQKVTL